MYNSQEIKNKHVNKLIFLDIDGCVTSKNDESYFNPDPAKYHPSKNIVNKLVDFCKDNDIMIVVSSNWRKFDIDGTWTNSYGTYKNPLSELISMISDVYLDTLPPDRHVTKSVALVKWFNITGYTGKFVIFDDDVSEGYGKTDNYNIKNMFIQIDATTGITDNDLKKASDILGI